MSSKPSFPIRTFGTGMVTSAIGFAALGLPLHNAPLVGGALFGIGVVVDVASVGYWWRGRRGTSATLGRWSRRSRRNGGVATWYDHLRRSSALSMRRRAAVLRPSLGELRTVERWRTPVTEYAARLGTSGRRTYWISTEDVVLRIAGARSGKTSAMAARIIEAPGSVVVTSTRKDLLYLTAQLRADRGPIYIFNPGQVGGIASTLKWSPLSGCTDIATAMRRAADLIPPATTEERETWNTQARRVLAPLLFAAARDGLSMRKVLGWVAATGDTARTASDQVMRILEDAPESAAMRDNVAQFFGMSGRNDKTRTSITTTLMPALNWLGNPKAEQIGDAQGDDVFSVDELLDGQSTLYLLGADDGATGALTAALVAEIAYQASRRAERSPGGRLDPSLLLALDEAALMAPGPLDRWTSDMGGRAICLDIAVQSLAWLQKVWGDNGARIILGNAAVVLLGAGCKDPADLDHWERLSGTRNEVVETYDADGSVKTRSTRLVPVMSRDQIAALPKGHAVVFGAGPISILRTPNAHKRRDVRRAQRSGAYAPVVETDYAGRATVDMDLEDVEQ